MITLNQQFRNQTKEVDIALNKFDGGVVKLVEEARVKDNESVEAFNMILEQDGVWTPRWGTAYYSTAIDGVSGLDGFTEYVKSDGTRELIVVGDDGNIYKSTDGGSNTEITTSGAASAGLTAGNRCYFQQIKSALYIANGVDALVRYDGTNISTYTELSAPDWDSGTPIARGAGLSSGSYTYYYQITALNEVGETTGNTEESIAVDILREDWDEADEYIALDWDAVSGATRYQIYMSDESGYEVLIGSTTDTAFTDGGTTNGAPIANPYIEVPDDNTTGAPKFTHMIVSNNRLWATGDPDNKFRVYGSGTGQFMGYFSDYYGGFWIDLEKGGREEPIAITHFIDGSGNGKATTLCKTPEGRGSVWQLDVQTITVEGDSFSVPSAIKIVGSVGTNSPLSVVQTEKDIWFANVRGVFSLGPQANYFGILRTSELSSRIRPYWRSITGSAISSIASYYKDAKVFLSIPRASTTNNRIILYDTERDGWIVDWNVGASQFGEYTDSDGVTHLLISQDGDGRLLELSENISGDKGVAFPTSYISPRITMSKDWASFAKIKKAYLRLGDPVGEVNFEVLGTQKNKPYSSLVSKTVTVGSFGYGMGFDLMGRVQMGSASTAPTSPAQASEIRFVKVNKKLRDIQFRVTSEDINTDFSILGLMADGFLIDTSPPSDWKLS